MTRARRAVAALALTSGALLPASAAAQHGFGQNKVQYRAFEWHVLRGGHVDVYYYPAEEQVARLALVYGEESFDYLARRLGHEPRARVPLIVYASHSDFEQTNVLPFVPPEGVLGVTESLKRRVTLPFRGSYAEFRHTLRHELVHVFQLSLLQQQRDLRPRARRVAIPLWWSEGLAEYLSSPQDSRDEMVVRDLTLGGRLPSLDELGASTSPLVYPLGGELHRFLGERYGDWRAAALYADVSRYASFDEALAAVYGHTPAQLGDEWRFALRQRYFPGVAGRAPISLAGRKLADLSVQPVAVPRGDSAVDVAYLSPRSGYTNIYLQPLSGSGRARVAVAGERSPEFESFHAFASRIDARAGVLLFASKFGDRDALFFWDVARRRVVGRYAFDSLVAILSPAWSPDGRRVAFSGLTLGGVSDLYVLTLRDGALARATDDRYEDTDPTWLPDGRSLVFSSDRAPGGDEGARNLYRVDVDTRRIEPLTRGRWRDESPRWDSAAGRVLFVSDRDGTFNLYSTDTLGTGRRESRLDGGVFDPAPLPGGGRVLVTGFGDLSWSVYALPLDSAARAETFALADSTTAAPASPAGGGSWDWAELADARATSAVGARYRRRFSLDFATGGSTAVPGYGAAQGGQIVFSDLLGDHQLSATIASYGSGGLAGIFDNFNADLFYLDQRQRLNWGVGAFRTAGEFFAGSAGDFSQLYRERSLGAYGALRYPLSRFRRVEGQTRLEYSNRDDFGNTLVSGPLRRKGLLATNVLSVSSDNTLQLETGPIDGTRWNLSGAVTSDLTHGVFENWLGTADVRHLVRTSLQSAIALRGFGYVSDGTRPRAIQVGGSWLLRGYPRSAVSGTRAWVWNSEWRFPLANFVTLGLPVGAVRFPQFQGALFGDLGQAWYRGAHEDRVLGSAGLGVRTAIIPGLVLRLDVGRRFSFAGDGRTSPALDAGYYRRRFVDFFFGYNY